MTWTLNMMCVFFSFGLQLMTFWFHLPAFDDCSDVLNVTGVYYITNRGSDSFPVLCDQSADGGGEKLFPVCLGVCVKCVHTGKHVQINYIKNSNHHFQHMNKWRNTWLKILTQWCKFPCLQRHTVEFIDRILVAI